MLWPAQDNGFGFASGPVEFDGFVVQAQGGKDTKKGKKNMRSGSPGQRRRGNSPGQRQSRLPGLNGANGPATNGGPRQRTPYQMENSKGLNGQRRPTPRRGARGTGFSPRGNAGQQAAQQQAAQKTAQQQQAQGWTTGSEAPGHVTTAKLSPRKTQANAENDQRTSPETDPPDSPPQDEVRNAKQMPSALAWLSQAYVAFSFVADSCVLCAVTRGRRGRSEEPRF